MAGKVVINTKLKTDGVARGATQIQKDIDKVVKAQERLQAKFDKFDALGGDKNSKAYQAMRYEADLLNTKLYDLQDEMGRVSQSVVTSGQSFNQAGNAMKAFQRISQGIQSSFKVISSLFKKLSSVVKSLGSAFKKMTPNIKQNFMTMLKYAFGIRSVFVLVNKLRRALVDGFKNLAQFNNGINPINDSLSRLMSALTRLKNSFASAFAPLLTAVEPILTRIINLLSNLMTLIGKFIGALTGATSFIRATKVQQNFAESLKQTGASAKKASKQLAGFYDLNAISSDKDSGGGAGGLNPNDMFQVVDIEQNIRDMADRVRAIIQPMLDWIKEYWGRVWGSIKAWIGELNFQPLIDAFGKLKTALAPAIDLLGDAFLWLLENVLEPIGKWAIESFIPKFIETVAKWLEVVIPMIKDLKPVLLKIWDEIIKPFGKKVGEGIIAVLDDVKDRIEKAGVFWEEHKDEILEILAILVDQFKAKFELIKIAVEGTIENISTIINGLKDVFNGIIDFIKNVFEKDFDSALNSIVEGVIKPIVRTIAQIFETTINGIIDMINVLDIEIPDWVPAFGGKDFKIHLDHVSIPHLASGTVVPRQSKEFMAILGDNNRESEVVSPLSTMKQAFKEAMAESNMSGDMSVNVYLEGDAKGLFRVVRAEANNYSNRTGSPAFI